MKTKHDNNGGITLIEDLVDFLDERAETFQSVIRYLNSKVDTLTRALEASHKRTDGAMTSVERAGRQRDLYQRWLDLDRAQHKVDLEDADERLDRYVLGAGIFGAMIGATLTLAVRFF